MASRGAKKRQRLKYLQELARESILKYAPKPLTPQEIHDHNWMKIMKDLIRYERYHKPAQKDRDINKYKLTTRPLQTTIIKLNGI